MSLNEITMKTYNCLLSHEGENKSYSTEDLMQESGYDTTEMNVSDLMKVDYDLHEKAEDDGIDLDSSYANGLFYGLKFEIPFLVKKATGPKKEITDTYRPVSKAKVEIIKGYSSKTI